MPQSGFLVESILPSQEIHLMAGPSGSGKTRWLFDTLLQWHAGLPVLGFESNPVPWVYVSADRSLASVNRTLEAMRIPRESIPLVSAWSEHLELGGIFDKIKKSGAKLAVVESFGSFVDPPATANCVKQFLGRVDRFMQETETTFLGVVESPKLKPSEKYENPRQRISGVATWGHYAETIFLLEPHDAATPADPFRILNVCPRNGPGMTLELCFDKEGHLKPSSFMQSINNKRVSKYRS
jgi:hypothetical protein